MGSHRDERWPLSPSVLADRTRCPDCFTLISAPVCPRCGFVLTDPRAARLLELGTAIAEADRQRRILLNEIRLDPLPAPATFEGVAAPVARPEAAAPLVDPTASAPEAVMSETATPAPDMAAPSPQPVPTPGAAEPAQGRTPASDVPPPALPVHSSTALTPSPAAPSPTPTAPSPTSPAPASAAPASAPSAPPRRRLTVPVLLLIVGVSLVGIAAIFFLTLAWFVADVLVRALIIAGVTAAVIAAASLLRRRRLTATAEGVAALGVLLLGLDAWGVRANDLLGAGATDAAVYTGVAVLAVGALCRAWALASSLRVPDLAAVVAVPAGLGFLVAGIADLPAPGGLVAGLLGASAGGLAHALPRPWSSARSRTDAVPERTALAVAGVVAVALSAVLTPFSSPGSLLWLALAVVVLAVAHAVAARRDRADLPWAGALAHTASVVGVVTAATLGWQLSGVSPSPVVAFLVAPVLAVAVPVAVDRFARRRDAFAPARIAGALVGVVSVAAVVLRDVGAALPLIAHRWVPWRMDAFAGTPVRHQELALIAAVLCAALLFAAPSLGRRLLRDARPVAAALLLLAAATRTGVMAAITGTAIAVVVAGLVLLALRTRAAGSPARPTATGAGVTIALGAVVACTAGAATPWLWFTAVAVTVAAPVAARVISSPTGPVAVLLTLAPVAVAAIAAAIAPQPIAVLADAMPPGPSAAIALVQWVAALTLLAAVVLRLDTPSRSALALAGGGLALVTIGAGLPALLGAEPDAARAALVDPAPAAVVRAVALLGLVALLALSRTRVTLSHTRFTAAAALLAALTTAPAAAWAARTVLVGTGALDPAVAPLTAMIAAVAVSIGAAVLTLRSGEAARRGLADAGAALVVASVVWAVPTADAWMALLALTAGFAAAATTRGWAAPASVRLAGVPTAPIGGVPWRRAPRRLLVWPAIGAATQALWVRLATTDAPLEAFTVPPALALLVLAATAVWLRRHPEATVATSLAFAIGLIVPALESWDGSPARGTVVAAVAAVLCLALTCTPAHRVVGPAWAGAAVALVALGAVVVPRAADGETPLWLLLLVAVAFAAGLGATRTDAVSLHVFAFVAPPAALLWSLAGLSPHAGSLTTIVVALTIAAALHLASAWQNVAPFAVPTRASAVVALAVIAGLGLGSDALPVLEAATLPVAVVVLAGAALALWRATASTRAVDAGVPPDSAARPASGARALAIERVVWISGVVLAVAPSVLAPASPARWWTVIVLSLLAAGVAASVSRSVASVAGLVVPTTLVLAGAGIAMGARALLSDADGGGLAAFVAGTGAVAVAAVRVWREPRPTPVPPALAAVGGGLVFVTTLVPALSSSGEVTVLRTVATAVLAAAGALGGATLLGAGRWAGLGGVVAIGGTVTAGTALGIRFALGRGGLEADLCALAVLVIVAAVGALALRRTRVPLVDAVVGGAFAATIVLFAVAELTLLRAAGHEWRALLVTSALVAMGVLGQAFAVRVGRAVSIAALVALVLFGGAALLLGAIPAIETLTVPVAAGLLVLGIRAMSDPEVRTWPALGPGLAVLTLPSLAYDLGGNALWRVVALGVAALALVVLGAMRRLQAPLVLGSVVLLVHGVAQLWPWIAATYVAVPWWLWLGIGGVLLILLAARYERQMRALRTAFTAVAALR
ncbi:SCO7613 C-terminal domain-containing membrane protein [Microbacterium sp. No. 7]|uniref:SCO7613 C-terminal domain-containing membrane protein n=1 Tax=Microbacterium sp. No. 7 TaxID=1714373 RepID=UPI0006D219E3|nr:hypothetical protein [Microbacterium sp. No. 7]ALJ18735.1 hypothetical protein AOA12_01925 [Microbacterium sp. No. 7]